MNEVFQKLSQMLGIHEVPPLTDAVKSFAQRICRDEAITQVICENIISSYFGNSHYLNAVGIYFVSFHRNFCFGSKFFNIHIICRLYCLSS